MSNFNNDILIQNIKHQMQKHKESQVQLAAAIEMSQPNFNKAINQVDGKRFTLEQLYSISQHYKVGIDELINNTTVKNYSMNDIFAFVRNLIENGDVDVVDITYEDTVFETSPDEVYPRPFADSQENPYKALVFPNYKFENKLLSDYYRKKKEDEYFKNGNNNYKNQCINLFLEKYHHLFTLYKKGDLEKDVLDLAVKHYIEDLEFNEILL